MGVHTLGAQQVLEVVRAHSGEACHLPLHSRPVGGGGVDGDCVIRGLAAVGLQQAARGPGLRVRADGYLIRNCTPRAASDLCNKGSLPSDLQLHTKGSFRSCSKSRADCYPTGNCTSRVLPILWQVRVYERLPC